MKWSTTRHSKISKTPAIDMKVFRNPTSGKDKGYWTTWLFCIALNSCMVAQSVSPEMPMVGSPVPNKSFDNIKYYSRTSVTAHELKGKWLVLSFWSPGCSNSVNSLPKFNEIQKEFKQELTWLLIGMKLEQHKEYIEDFYEKLHTSRNLNLPITFSKDLPYDWKVPNIPYNIIIDPEGIVRFITDDLDISIENFRKLIAGEPVSFYDKRQEENRPPFDPFRLNSEEETKNLLYHKILVPYNGENIRTSSPDIFWWDDQPESRKQDGYRFIGAPLFFIYNHAYRGKSYWHVTDKGYGWEYMMPIIETKDPSLFQFDRTRGLYNYSLLLPPDKMTPEHMMKAMQEDLVTNFGVYGILETRSMPVWKLIAKPGAIDKLKTKGEKKFVSPGNHMFGFTVKNIPPEFLISVISVALMPQYLDPFIPFIDETGLTQNFDLMMNTDMSNLDCVRYELKKIGLDLVQGTKEMRVLVLRDVQP
jgi:hypothetical protein